MKYLPLPAALAAVFTFALLVPSTSAQVFIGSDNFNDNTLTLQTFPNNVPGPQLAGQWRFSSPNQTGTGGAWTETNGRMQWTTTSTTGFNRGQLGWSSPSSSITADGSVGLSGGTPYNSSWSAQVQTTNLMSLTAGVAAVGFEIYTLSSGNANNGFYSIALNLNTAGMGIWNEWGMWNPTTSTFAQGNAFRNTDMAGVTSAVLRMNFDSLSKNLQFSYSIDAGATFITISTLDLDGAHAGPEAPLNGGMGLRLYAVTDGGAGAVGAGMLSYDNFSVIPEPSTYAALFGLGALGFVMWRRRRAATPASAA
ncbi:MAG: hypothetical protein C0518_03785 [Opitutus sp.]|nr:hypothetical protein [Opitutus sp.]